MVKVNWNQLQMNIKNEVERIGFKFLADRPASNHPDDWYLRIVIGYHEGKQSYATWLYNAEQDGLFHGKYDMDQSQANESFLVRT